ncbi:enoyl-CoA hydratase/isomerase family protein [uncultured Roseibium sp.]|uniref:enoyl-CoA hydratase/isomerase family protein n=1 Tax=uncultured Roseibium sp. TaxID=1936171 RepID=UPI002635B771|nr:enoyl-CoA hydratase/isomerase family protein [uncultured Roseibium sp.]
MKPAPGFVETEERDGAVWVRMNRPHRHNALVPDLLLDLRAAILAAAQAKPVALVICAKGTSFSTGGDLLGFLEHGCRHQELLAYSDRLVGLLHEAILDLLTFPAPVLAAVNGPVTGGSAGLIFAADMVAMSEDAFIQPYYSEVGFGPDGGWTALLSDRIGAARSLQVQYLNERVFADEALALGLVSRVCKPARLEADVGDWIAVLGSQHLQSHLATRRNVWDELRLEAVRKRLGNEKEQFLELVARPETIAGLKAFTS